MNQKLRLALTLAAGLAGGMLSRFVAPPSVFAQTPEPAVPAVTQDVRAQSFTLVDADNNTLGTFTAAQGGVGFGPLPRWRILLRDASGREIWSASGSVVRPLAAESHSVSTGTTPPR